MSTWTPKRRADMTPEQHAARLARDHRYNTSDKGRARNIRYNRTPAGALTRQAWEAENYGERLFANDMQRNRRKLAELEERWPDGIHSDLTTPIPSAAQAREKFRAMMLASHEGGHSGLGHPNPWCEWCTPAAARQPSPLRKLAPATREHLTHVEPVWECAICRAHWHCIRLTASKRP